MRRMAEGKRSAKEEGGEQMTPAISMLLPARARPTNLRTSVASLFRLAADPSCVEVLLRLDDDDPHLADELRILGEMRREFDLSADRIVAWTGPRLGYPKMHHYYNGLAERARGDWLFIWNDDIDMVSAGWDRLLLDAPLFSVQFPRRDIAKTTDYTLPVVGRPWYSALGHLSMNAYCDAWISDVSAFAGTSIVRDDIEFVHHRLDDDTLRAQANGNTEWAKFTADEQRAMRRADLAKIVNAPGHAARFNGWNTETVYHEVDYINLAAKEYRAYSVVLKGRK